jgi:hypothetical protein
VSRAGALLAAPLLAGALLGTATAAGASTTSGAAPDLGPVRVSISRVAPASPAPGDTLVISGRAVNAGTLTIGDVGVRILVDRQPIGSRAALAEAAATDVTDPAVADAGGTVIESSVVQGLTASLVPGASVPFAITLPADDLGLGGFGVHALTVEVRGVGLTGRVTVGSVRTFLVWQGQAPLPKLRLTWLVPLQDRPVRGVQGTFDRTAAGTLAAALDTGGRLQSLLAAGAGEPITWAVDADLLEETSELAAGAPLDGGGTSTPDDAAQAWLTALTAAKDVRALPYGDPDLTAQRHAGISRDLLGSVATGESAATRVLNKVTAAAPAWPVDGLTTPGTLLGAQAAGLTQVVLASDDAPTTVATTATPDAIGPLDGSGLQVVTSDSTLAGLAANDPRLLGNPTVARLRILAETAMIAAERPSDPRSVVVALPRDWAPSAAWARAMLTLDHVAPWLVPTDLTDLTANPGDAPARRLGPYPQAAQQAEVSQRQLRPVAQTFTRLQRFGQILTSPEAYLPSFTAALRRAQSAAWRAHPADGQVYADKVAAALLFETHKVRILPRGQVTLSSRTGGIPLAVRNGLTQDVRVTVQLTSVPAFRLDAQPSEVQTLRAGSTASVEVPASATADGRIQVVARLTTPAGDPFGGAVAFDLRATGYGEVARLVAGVLVVLLGLAVIVRVVRRIRAGAAAADAAAADIIAEEAEHR